jgi:two-component system, chemotaxis family, protein-glutamate methylesterase/glutaminase
MAGDSIRVLVVDDSAVIRTMICAHITAAPDMSVAGIACNGVEALEAVDALQPDVITLDLQMPGMDGLEVLDTILRRHPIPVIIVSSLTHAGAAVTLDALDRGAADYVAKPEVGHSTTAMFVGELIHKIRNAICMDIQRMLTTRGVRTAGNIEHGRIKFASNPPADVSADKYADMCIAIGISTGGPPALTKIMESLYPPLPPIVIVQHMPPQFTRPLANRLNSISALSIREAAHDDSLQPNCVFIAPGGKHLELRQRGKSVKVAIRDGEPVSGHKPSVDVMMISAAEIYGSDCLGMIMTGMGRDGANGCRAIRAAGGYVMGQDEASSDVYGMNKVAYMEGNVDKQFALQDAATVIALQMRRLTSQAVHQG